MVSPGMKYSDDWIDMEVVMSGVSKRNPERPYLIGQITYPTFVRQRNPIASLS
jgi:hypothetical protein